MIISNTNYNIPDSLGIVLNFDLKKRSMFDFSQIDSLVNIGYLETKKQIEGIKMKVQGRVSMDEINRKRVLFRNSPL